MAPPSKENYKQVTETGRNRSFRWDQASGQFSFSQEDEAHLEAALGQLEDMAVTRPDTVAVLIRQYTAGHGHGHGHGHCSQVVIYDIVFPN